MIASLDGGGSERQTLLLLRHLDRRRFAPELYVLRRGGALYDQIPTDVPVHSFDDQPPRRGLAIPGQVYRAQIADLRRLIVERNIDVVYDRTFHMTLIAGPATAASTVPRVSTIVSPPSQAVPLNAGRFLRIKRRRLASAYVQSAKVIGVSHSVVADARRYYGLNAAQITCVPNPVDAGELLGVVDPSGPPNDRYTIVCVGRMTIEKGQETLVRAIALLRELHPEFSLPKVWLVGDGPLRPRLEQFVGELKLGCDIDFVGHALQPACLIAQADALCLPSLFEGFPNVMLEAMALGTPVIANSIDVVKSLGRVAPPGPDRGRDYALTYNGTAEELATKIRRLWLNPTATRSRTIAARNLALRVHAIEAIVPRIEQILESAHKSYTTPRDVRSPG